MLSAEARFQNRPRKKQCRHEAAFSASRYLHANPWFAQRKSENQKCYFEGGWCPSPITNNEVKRQSLAWRGSELLMLAEGPGMDSH
jgi:hypothetical protein